MWDWLGNSYPFVRRVIVTTKTGQSLRGVLWQRCAGYLVLREAEVSNDRGVFRAVVGELLVDQTNVDYIQVIGTGGE
jgi:small nuclear ribonucleoprotein (snRNP)-like protein